MAKIYLKCETKTQILKWKWILMNSSLYIEPNTFLKLQSSAYQKYGLFWK